MLTGEWRLPAEVAKTTKMRRVVKDPRRRAPLPAVACVAVLLTACGQENRYIAPPPPKVIVQLPLQQMVTPYLEATGNAASINAVKLVARVQGYVQEIKYQDGTAVKKGTPLFVIEPEPYKVQLEQAQAAEEGAKATLVNAEAEFTRQQELQSRTCRRRPISTGRAPIATPPARACCRRRPTPRPRRSILATPRCRLPSTAS
jgi:multidrug resistance efflux pump